MQNDPNIGSKIVGFSGLAADLASGTFANYVHIVPNQCNEMHGLNAGSAPNCDYGAFGVNTADANTQTLISQGDKVIKGLVDQITAAPFWNQGNNAIVLSWDEDNFVAPFTQGCCGSDPASAANFGGGRVANVVITSKGPRGVTDNTPYNHYSFLRTVEDAFGLYDPSQYSAASAGLAGYLNEAGDTVNGVRAQTQLFAANVPEPAVPCAARDGRHRLHPAPPPRVGYDRCRLTHRPRSDVLTSDVEHRVKRSHLTRDCVRWCVGRPGSGPCGSGRSAAQSARAAAGW